MATTWGSLDGTRWTGTGELWLDPLGDVAERCECGVNVVGDELRYRWSYRGEPQEGTLTRTESGASFRDSWHQPTPMACEAIAGSWAMLAAAGTYDAGEGPEWGWRVLVSHREMGPPALVVQMTNVAPWGEETRAVRMVVSQVVAEQE